MENQHIASLMLELTCDEMIKCQKARRALVEIGHEAVPFLVEALSSDRNWIRWEAAKALAQIGDPAATESLIKALEDKEFDVRWLAAEGLIAIGKKSVIPLLKALIDSPKSIWLHEGAHHVLHDMNRGDLDTILKPVMSAIEGHEPSLEVPSAAAKALENISPQAL